ncbi:OST-HTH/LOTUS domain-containing protein [Rhodoferax sp. TS-BS-61-7]|uniref:OST-HTH/LOTUS domain-containing protein n=1 Tax=Rhodoferax sp. TS-BS-61-7 TaxID=2094194 RepID=UPI000CF6EB85|nr:OST-HTH/LOTUS domain-containing protein [Rhodoferax sp. TS-BS-61-7]PQA78075.1 hypothetical protein C5F53_06995 [Rhodoferax sp. TS-BS-61-7]
MEEPPYAALQREVQRKLGRCMIRIQQYELLLKEMVAKREVSGILGSTPAQLAESAPDAAPRTMGQLVGELTGKYFQPTLLESGETPPETSSDDDEHPAGWARIRMSVSMPPDAHAKLIEELQELVDLRNDLVHHFVEGQDLVTEEGCIAADMYLHDCYEEIDRHLVSLRGWAASSNEAMRSMAAFMESPEYKAFLMAEFSPSVSQREAALPALVELLRRAEADVAKDGWTSQTDAIAFIKKVAPEETPRKYTFGSWRHVLRDAGAFEVRRAPVSPGGPMESWYRSKS